MAAALSAGVARTHADRAIFRAMRSMTWKGAVAWAVVFASVAVSVAKSWVSAYPTEAERAAVAKSLGANFGFRALYGNPHAIDTVGGFTAWRIGSTMAVLAGVWMLLAATRLLRGEEDDGRWELLMAGATTPARGVAVAAGTLATWLAVAWIALTASLLGIGLPAAGSLIFGAQIAVAGAVFGAAGLLASQLVPIRRRASGIAGIFLGVTFLLRIVADGTTGLGWVRWLTPFGWIEEARPYGGDRVLPLVLAFALTAVLCVSAIRIAASRDLGRGVLFEADTARGRTAGLGSARSFAVRQATAPALVWSVSMGVFGFVLGMLANDVVKFVRSASSVSQIFDRLGASLTAATGYLGFALGYVAVVAATAAGFRIAADRDEEATGRLDNLLVRAVARRAWFLWQGAVAVGVAACVAIVSAFLMWAGAASRGTSVPVLRLLEGGLNCIPVCVLFVGFGLLAMALVPRATVALTLGAIAVSFLIELVGSLAEAPSWVLDLSAFHHVAPVPAVEPNVTSAAVMLCLGVVFAIVGAAVFGRRDIAGA